MRANDIVCKLLAKDITKRYQNPRNVCRDLMKYGCGYTDTFSYIDINNISVSNLKLSGRENEITLLKKKLDKAVEEGTGFACLISGEAGIGKTRLAEELRDYVHMNNGIFLKGKASYSERAIPYMPFSEIFNNYLRYFHLFQKETKDIIRERAKRETGDSGRIVLNINNSMRAILGNCKPPLSLLKIDTERDNKRYASVLIRFITSLTTISAPLVILLDDLQWMDEASCLSMWFIESYPGEEKKYRFIHDRVWEAFYTGIKPDHRKTLHLKIASEMENQKKNESGDLLFETANHYIKGGDRNKTRI